MLTRFLQDRSGQFAVIFTLIAVPTLLATGVAVDFSRLYNKQSEAQEVLDAAILAAIKENTARNARITARKTVRAHGLADECTFVPDGFVLGDEKTYAGRMDCTMDLSIMQIRDMLRDSPNDIAFSVRSKAAMPQVQDQLYILPTAGNGYHRKLMRLRQSAPDGSVSTLCEIEWDPISETLNPGCNGWIALDPGLPFWFDMKVYDIDGKTSNQMTIDMYGADQTFETNDPNHSHQLFIDGVQQPRGQAIDFAEKVGCGEQKSVDWEDLNMPDGHYVWGKQDFSFDIKGSCIYHAQGAARLVY